MSDHLLSDVTDGVGTITLNRPEVMNAFSPELIEGMVATTLALERDPAVRCVVLRGAGDHFVAGGNPKGFIDRMDTDRATFVDGAEQRVVHAHLMVHRIRRMRKPVIAAVQGAAAGFGFSLVCAADYVIAADDAYFAPAYTRIGLPGDGGVSYFLPRIVGERRALDIILLGERFDAAKALGWGLVNQVVPVADLAIETNKLARRFADGPTLALGLAKHLVRGSLDRSWDEQSALEAAIVTDAVDSLDHREGLMAFVEKRKPRFTGQ